MILKTIAGAANPLLDFPHVRRVRRNHGLEHATITILSGRIPNLVMSGRADYTGFTLWGEAPQEQVEQAVRDALARMKGGEAGLAIHPNCGTNLVTQSVLVSFAALGGSVGIKRGWRDYLDRLPIVMLLGMLAILFGKPLGMQMQEHFTTSGAPGDLEIKSITRREAGSVGSGTVTVHRVNTRLG